MSKKNRVISFMVFLCICLMTVVLLVPEQKAFAFSGTGTLSEQALYNATNTFDVKSSYFDNNGDFQTTYISGRGNQYQIEYNMQQRNVNVGNVMNNAQITVLTHGLDSNARVWSNNFSANNHSNISFAYDSSSLITKISEQVGGANIYWAKMSGYKSFDLYNITNQTGSYSNNFSYETQNIVDISKHIVIVFDAYRNLNMEVNTSLESNDNVYYQFNYMLSKIIYDVKIANGGTLPKVNLIGHSRGGITNLQYAMDHPDLVSSLISIGTPYFGSNTARLFGEAFMGECDGLDDILDAQLYYGYNTRWNINYSTLYQDINVQAIGSCHTISSLMEVVHNDLSGYFTGAGKVGAIAGITAIAAAKSINLLPIARNLLLKAITNCLDCFFPESSAVDVAEILVSEINFSFSYWDLIWDNDVLVPLDSQLGENDGSVQYGGGDYLGFNRYNRIFTSDDNSVNYLKVSQAMPPVAHNLEARDEVIISKIISELDLGVNSQPAYVTQENGDGTLTFVMYKGIYPHSSFIIPDTLNGKAVTKIAPFAFKDENNITEVTIPATVREIGAYAFAGLTNLTRVNISSGTRSLETIRYAAFAGCESLSKFDSSINGRLELSSSVIYIESYAFCNTAFVNTCINGNVNYVGGSAFACNNNLTSITASGTNYFSVDGVLYNADGWLLQYPAGKISGAFSVPSAVNNINIRFISPFAFYGAINLSSVNLNNVISIAECAFADCQNLCTIIGDNNIQYVAPFAFAGTDVFDTSDDFNVIGQVLVQYNGEYSVLNETDFPTGINRIATYAFYDNDEIQTIYLPLTIQHIDDYAFYNCENLETVRYLNNGLPNINDYPFMDNSDSFSVYCRKSIIDDLTINDNWYVYVDSLVPVSTSAYFIDLNSYVDFYYGQTVSIPSNSITGYYNKGWQRYDEMLQEPYGSYLTPSAWLELIDEVSFKADLVLLESYTLVFYNGEQIVGSFIVNTGDYYELGRTSYTLNGITTQFTGYLAMDNCAYLSYYGSPFINNVEIAIFNGWKLNEEAISSGQWMSSYSSGGLAIYSDWDPVLFTAEFIDCYNNTYQEIEFSYFSSLPFSQPTYNGYVFNGWYDGQEMKYTTLAGCYYDIVLSAHYDELFTVSFAGAMGFGTNFPDQQGIMGTVIQLYTGRNYLYHIEKWGEYYAGSNYIITGNVTLYASLRGNEFPITYQNLTFINHTASLWLNGSPAPTYYEYGVGLDLTNIIAVHNPEVRFLGWYTSSTLSTKIEIISPTRSGEVLLYAKWRYDIGYNSRSRTYTITDAGEFNQGNYYDIYHTGFSTNTNLYNQLIVLGFRYLSIKFKIRLWEVNDGYQEIYFYSGSGNDTLLWSKTDIEHDPSGVNGNPTVYTFIINIPLTSLQDTEDIYIRYSAHGRFGDTWQNDKIYYELSYVAKTNDIGAPSFYWSGYDPF
ncbi:MAG: alpha/beta fold hydrolase [Clostridia bacterium]|nr:alpha/beta fold hydrolase [Clostridia bacterium]